MLSPIDRLCFYNTCLLSLSFSRLLNKPYRALFKPQYSIATFVWLLAATTGVPVANASDSHRSPAASHTQLSLRARAAYLETYFENQPVNAGQALSYRLRLDWQHAFASHFNANITFDHIDSYWQNQHSDGVRFNNKPAIPDAPSTQINQAFVSFKSQGAAASIGKQTLLLSNQRFIGSNGFWQDEQTFNSAQASYALGFNTQLAYHYINKAYRISGPNAGKALVPADSNYTAQQGLRPLSALGEHLLSGHIFNATTTLADYHTFEMLSAFINNKTVNALNHNTVNINYHFKRRLGLWLPEVEAALATQARNQVKCIGYYQLKGTLGLKGWKLALEREHLGTKQQTPFITPLGSLHEFQGFADQFLSTPQGGLNDDIVHVGFRKQRVSATIAAHYFTAASTSGTRALLGKELNITLNYRPSKALQLAFKYAYFTGAQDNTGFSPRVKRAFLTATFSP